MITELSRLRRAAQDGAVPAEFLAMVQRFTDEQIASKLADRNTAGGCTESCPGSGHPQAVRSRRVGPPARRSAEACRRRRSPRDVILAWCQGSARCRRL